MTEEITALLEEIKKLPEEPDTFDLHTAVELSWTIRNGIVTLQRETDKLYRSIIKS